MYRLINTADGQPIGPPTEEEYSELMKLLHPEKEADANADDQ